MTYSRRNIANEQQEACQKATQITAICEQFQITLDPIDWHQFGMGAPVKVNGIAIASLLAFGHIVLLRGSGSGQAEAPDSAPSLPTYTSDASN